MNKLFKANQLRKTAPSPRKSAHTVRLGTCGWITLCSLLIGVVFGFLLAPVKHGINVTTNVGTDKPKTLAEKTGEPEEVE